MSCCRNRRLERRKLRGREASSSWLSSFRQTCQMPRSYCSPHFHRPAPRLNVDLSLKNVYREAGFEGLPACLSVTCPLGQENVSSGDAARGMETVLLRVILNPFPCLFQTRSKRPRDDSPSSRKVRFLPFCGACGYVALGMRFWLGSHMNGHPRQHNSYQRLRRNCISATYSFQCFAGNTPADFASCEPFGLYF